MKTYELNEGNSGRPTNLELAAAAREEQQSHTETIWPIGKPTGPVAAIYRDFAREEAEEAAIKEGLAGKTIRALGSMRVSDRGKKIGAYATILYAFGLC